MRMVLHFGVGLIATPTGLFRKVRKAIYRCPVQACPRVEEVKDGMKISGIYKRDGEPVTPGTNRCALTAARAWRKRRTA